MATILEIDPKHTLGLYDSDTKETLKTEKVVDITDDCPDASEQERALLLFATAKRGRIVQIVRPYRGEVCMGSAVHFFVDEIEHEFRLRESSFAFRASMLGLTKTGLRNIIEEHAPQRVHG